MCLSHKQRVPTHQAGKQHEIVAIGLSLSLPWGHPAQTPPPSRLPPPSAAAGFPTTCFPALLAAGWRRRMRRRWNVWGAWAMPSQRPCLKSCEGSFHTSPCRHAGWRLAGHRCRCMSPEQLLQGAAPTQTPPPAVAVAVAVAACATATVPPPPLPQNVKWKLVSRRRRELRHRAMDLTGIVVPTKWSGRWAAAASPCQQPLAGTRACVAPVQGATPTCLNPCCALPRHHRLHPHHHHDAQEGSGVPGSGGPAERPAGGAAQGAARGAAGRVPRHHSADSQVALAGAREGRGEDRGVAAAAVCMCASK